MPYETELSPIDEQRFHVWKKQYAPHDSGFDYDLRGAFKAGLTPDTKTGHWPDTYKKPNHPTFSNESKYYKYAPGKAGSWNGETFMQPRQNFDSTDFIKSMGLGLLSKSLGGKVPVQDVLLRAFLQHGNETQQAPLQENPLAAIFGSQQNKQMSGNPMPSFGGDVMPRLMSAISGTESGGKYSAIGPITHTGDKAYGKYQVMGKNIPSWTREILGYEMSPIEFLNNPDAQEKVAHAKLSSYISKYGNVNDAASVWFSGRPVAGNNSRDVTGTSVPEYVEKVNNYFI